MGREKLNNNMCRILGGANEMSQEWNGHNINGYVSEREKVGRVDDN